MDRERVIRTGRQPTATAYRRYNWPVFWQTLLGIEMLVLTVWVLVT